MPISTLARRRALAVAAAAVLLPIPVLLARTGEAAVRTCSGKPQDINGDGYADVAIGAVHGGPNGGGRLHVFYGTAKGPATAKTGDAPNDQIFAQGAAGVPGDKSAKGGFGATVAVGDLNGDGCADVAVGAPSNASKAGAVFVLYGSTSGLTGSGAQQFTENVAGAGNAAKGEQFGSGLAIGDFDGDGIGDLAASAPFDTLRGKGSQRGAVAVLYGSKTGVNRGRKAVLLSQDSPSVAGAAENEDQFGFIIAAGELTGDGISDVVVGVPGEDAFRGVVQVLPGSPTGVGVKGSRTYSQGSAGVPDDPEQYDSFGYYVTTGDVNGDAADDLVVGAPGEDFGRGAVSIVLSDATTKALAAKGQTISQDTAGVDGVAADWDYFGLSVAVARLDNDRFGDVVVGTPQDAIGAVKTAGSVTVLRGSATGATTAGYGGVRISQDSPGVAGSAETGDAFGSAVSGAFVQGGGVESLVVSAPGENLGGTKAAGIVTVLRPSASGPTGAGSATLDPGAAEVSGSRAPGALFGLALD